MEKESSKTLFYRRVSWNDSQEVNDLQHLLAAAHKKLPSTELRSFVYSDGEMQGSDIDERNIGTCCHITFYVPRQSTSLVPVPSHVKSTEISAQLPPKENNFMEGDIFFLLKQNHLILCPSGVRESVAIAYINEILRRAGYEDAGLQFTIAPIADIDKVKLLNREGVKKVSLKSCIYGATADYVERKSQVMGLISPVVEELRGLFGKDFDPYPEDVNKRENLNVKLEVSFDGRNKGGELSKQKLLEMGNKILEEDEEGFTITTNKGTKLTANDMRLKKKVVLKSYGKSVAKEPTFNSMGAYFKELRDSGMLEQ